MRPSPTWSSLTCFEHDLGPKTSRVRRKGILGEVSKILKEKGKPCTFLFPQTPLHSRFSTSCRTCREKSRKPPSKCHSAYREKDLEYCCSHEQYVVLFRLKLPFLGFKSALPKYRNTAGDEKLVHLGSKFVAQKYKLKGLSDNQSNDEEHLSTSWRKKPELARAEGRELDPAPGKAEFPLPTDLQDRKALPWHWNNTRGVEMSACGTGQASPASL